MRRLLYTVDRWGPAAISVLSLFLLAIVGWYYSERIANLEGKVTILQEQSQDRLELIREMNSYRAWMVAVYERVDRVGVKLPSPPESINVEDENSKKSSKKN